MEVDNGLAQSLVHAPGPVMVMAWLYDRAQLRHLEFMFLIRICRHPRSAMSHPPLQGGTRFLNENLRDSGWNGDWELTLWDSGLIDLHMNFDCRGERWRMETGSHTRVSCSPALTRADRSPLFTGRDSHRRAVRMMVAAVARFRRAPDMDMLIAWLQQINISARTSLFQRLLPFPRPVHPALLGCDPIRMERVTAQCVLYSRYAALAREQRQRQQDCNEQDGWILVEPGDAYEDDVPDSFMDFVWEL